MGTLLAALCAVCVALALGYLAACAGAGRWITPREWLALCTCSHAAGFGFVRNIYGDEINQWGGNRSIWMCNRCGKVQAREELFK